MFEITMPAIWPWSVKGSRWLTADRDLSWTGHWVSQFNWIVNWHQTTMPWNSSGNVYPCLSANWKSSFGRHVHTGALITMPAVPWQRLAKFRWTYTRHWQISQGAQPIRPSYIPLRGREFDYNSENAYRLIESKLKQLANYSRIEFSVSWLDLDSNLRIRVAQNERICATKWENICDYLRFCLWESLGDPNPKEVEEKELVASIYWWLFNEISGERIIRFESFMNSLFHLGYMILIELNKVIK